MDSKIQCHKLKNETPKKQLLEAARMRKTEINVHTVAKIHAINNLRQIRSI